MPQHSSNPLFIGYGSIEDLVAVADRSRAFYANLITDPGPTDKYGLSREVMVIVITQPDQDNNVHYCQLRVGSRLRLAGRPMDGEDNQVQARAEAAWAIVRNWLAAHGLTMVKGVIAVPRDLKALDGWAEFLGYDGEAKRYYLRSDPA